MAIVKFLFRLLLVSDDGTSWHDLDDQMRSKIKLWGIICGIISLLTFLFSITLFLGLPSIQSPADELLTFLESLLSREGSPPTWLLSTLLVIFLILSLVLASALIDFGKAHYRLDSRTFHLIEKSHAELSQAIRDYSGCAQTGACQIQTFVATSSGQRRIMRDFFYFFANRDQVGSHNQEDKKREVFKMWGNYYVGNTAFALFLSLAAWLGYVGIVISVLPGWWNLILLLPAVLLIIGWHRMGDHFESRTRELAQEQVRAFYQEGGSEVTDKLRDVVGECEVLRCGL